ncbi:MAG: molybdenum cofactor guanylyltransferase [Rhodothermales bacterium]|nr:molybdenum cofactor guanylyltransferase [Rhodothermales bacterium]
MQHRVPPSLPPPAGLVLAGGRSTRFGSDKALALVDGRPMIQRVYHAVAALADPVFVSVGESHTTYDLPARHIVDRYPGRGPLAGIHAGLLASPAEWLLVAPCDMPFLDTNSLKKLLKARTADYDAVIAVNAEGLATPVLGLYHRRCLARIEARLALGELALQGLLDQLEIVKVRIDAEALRNVNAPEAIG